MKIVKRKKRNLLILSDNIPLMQELAFITHRKKILKRLEVLKIKEHQLFMELKRTNLLVTCECCFDDECNPMKVAKCNKGHLFCYDCIRKGSAVALENTCSRIRCFTQCSGEFTLPTLKEVLLPTQFSDLLKNKLIANILDTEVNGIAGCPFCEFAYIPSPEEKVFKCLNPECMKESCR